MFEVTAMNAQDYMRERGWLASGPVCVEMLSGGVSNIVLRIQTADRQMVLKQSRPQLRTRDAWFSDLDRVYREQEVMQMLHPLLPPLIVPEVLFVDRPNYVFVMSHAPAASRVWKESLLAGEIDLTLGERVGAILGLIHENTALDPRLVEPFRDHTVYVQLRVDPFYRRVQERRPEVAEAITPITERMLTVKEALCHGDYTPKNILAHDQGFTLVDYETAHYGDPTMDLGLCLAHLILKAFRLPAGRTGYFQLTRAFWRGYNQSVELAPKERWQAHGIEHFAVCALARIDGTSTVDYLPEEPKREAVRRLCRRVLWDGPTLWEDVLDMANTELAPLD
jgi:aminoglycoside phosphotransferase (APT) family kinase protein